MGQKEAGHDMGQFHKWSRLRACFGMRGVIPHGKESKIEEVLCEVQMVECLAYNEGAEDLGVQN
jgi:hypothetical protein